ncbi:MAG: hypothetical protein QXJ28_00650 [Candidatus Pacearchaeota archaeon]
MRIFLFSFFFISGIIFGLVCGYWLWGKKSCNKINIVGNSDGPGIITKTNIISIMRFNPNLVKTNVITNLYTVYLKLYNEYTNTILSEPVLKRQGFDNIEFKIYKQDYSLPLSFPKFTFGLGVGYNFYRSKIDTYFSIGYRVYENFGLNTILSGDFLSVGITISF